MEFERQNPTRGDSSDRPSISEAGVLAIFSGKAMLSRTVMCG